ncbi:hypothetical protein Ddye_020737 [Dipteronia dyeriana]|uniref:rRNA methyltransferase 1, mitochondrial n=1 Tax=Dipteronia dyeriana TaxID=168575 RepID=A0AAD9WX04_9ROSI|nr:hypothetical protein Ddye_020737 [Dipteronia dyeriana]
MRTMFSNLTSSQALPLAIRVSSQPTRLFKHLHSKSQYLPTGSHPKHPLNPIFINFSNSVHTTDKRFSLLKPTKFSNGFGLNSIEMGGLAKPTSLCNSFRVKSSTKSCALIRARSFSSLNTLKVGEGRRVSRAGKPFSFLKSKKAKEARGLSKVKSTNTGRSSWEESADRLQNLSTRPSSRDESAETFVANNKSRNRMAGEQKNHQNDYTQSNGSIEEQIEVSDDPGRDRDHTIRNRFRGYIKPGSEKPEFQRWNRQENLGRKTWKEATDESVPKMVGEGLYGVGPVLAALSAGRREFNALYVQEGLTLSSSNRKRKDKKGFEKVLKMAENIGLSIKETSKHDLNMVVGNRPHQGLVLDASPLEMVKIKELDPIPTKEDHPSLWVALDEVTDPQNLGAIIRSSFFFGASGVVLCAKNSAPLSGVVSKASAGSLELMELRYCNNMMQFLVSSAENGWRVLGGSVSSKAIALNEVPPGPPTVLVLGSEGTGLRPLVERSCTHLIRIPGNIPVDMIAGVDDMASDVHSGSSAEQFRSFLAVESLNVSVAAGVLIHHLIGHHYDKTAR